MATILDPDVPNPNPAALVSKLVEWTILCDIGDFAVTISPVFCIN